jgi:hypothetical protein
MVDRPVLVVIITLARSGESDAWLACAIPCLLLALYDGAERAATLVSTLHGAWHHTYTWSTSHSPTPAEHHAHQVLAWLLAREWIV